MNVSEELQNKIAAAIAHRGCCGCEQDLANGKLHGYCVVCGVEWPCDTAKTFMFSAPSPAQVDADEWTAEEREAIDELCKVKDMSEHAVLRQALRLYQASHKGACLVTWPDMMKP